MDSYIEEPRAVWDRPAASATGVPTKSIDVGFPFRKIGVDLPPDFGDDIVGVLEYGGTQERPAERILPNRYQGMSR